MSESHVSSSEAVISLTESAAAQVRSMQESQPEHAGKALRIYVEDGGCSGFQYGMVFDEHRDGDRMENYFGVPVLVDAFSAGYLKGAIVDFSDALTGGGFKITNPRARTTCGCGNSFEAEAGPQADKSH